MAPLVKYTCDVATRAVRSSTARAMASTRSEEHTSELQSRLHLVCRLLLEKKNAFVDSVNLGVGLPIGFLTQLATVCLGKRQEDRPPLIKLFVPLRRFVALVFSGCNIYHHN